MFKIITKVFQDLLKHTPCIILLDDMDKYNGLNREKFIFNILQTNFVKVRNG